VFVSLNKKVKKMAYNKTELSHALKQDLGYDYIEIEFILEEQTQSPKVEEKQKAEEKYVLGPVISRKELRKDRRSRQKGYIDFISPSHSNVFAPAERRISG
jgi:hypothetical protein